MAFTAVERGGEVRLTSILSHGTVNLIEPVRKYVDPSAILATDELPAYLAIGRQHGGHIRVNHSAGEFARRDVRTGLLAHCNTAESVHALFKRAIIGVFHQISGKHMLRYLREVEFHWNNRGSFEGRLVKMFSTKAGPLPLKTLFA